MFRYEVPADGQPHAFDLSGVTDVYGPLHVEAAGEETVEFWAEQDPNALLTRRAFRVFATGDELPDRAVWVGTTGRTETSGSIWHLYEVAP
jgi:hypothetical protein